MAGAMVSLGPSVWGVDSASKPNPQQCMASGYKFQILYLSIPEARYARMGQRNPKDWTASHVQKCADADVGIGVSVEQSSGTMMTGYSQTNKNLMKAATQGARDLGFPKSMPFIMNNDTNAGPNPADFQKALGAWRAYQEENVDEHPLYLYSGAWLFKQMMDANVGCLGGWHPVNATSWDHQVKDDRYNINQYGQSLVGGVTCDLNKILSSFPFWYPNAKSTPGQQIDKPPADPIKGDDDMAIRHPHIRLRTANEPGTGDIGDGSVYYSNGMNRFHLTSELALLQSLFETGRIGDDEWNRYMTQLQGNVPDQPFDIYSYVTVVGTLAGYGAEVK